MPRELISLSDENVHSMIKIGMRVALYKFRLDRSSAEDVVQNALVKVVRKLHMFRSDSRIETWFYKIVVRECLMYLRREASLRYCQLDFDMSDDNAGRDSLIQRVDNRNKMEVIRQALSHLKKDQKEILIRYFFEEEGVKELAEMFGKKEGTVKAIIWRGTSKVKEECLVEA